MNTNLTIPSPITKIELSIRPDLQFYIKRDDLIHNEISGNKYRKLQGILESSKDFDTIVTFGGAFSNHIVATAAISRILGIPSHAYIRTEEIDANNPTLIQCISMGMKLYAMNRNNYRQKTSSAFNNILHNKYSNPLVIPEGGSSKYASIGIKKMLQEIDQQLDNKIDYFICAMGTGSTACGIIKHKHSQSNVAIYPAIKGVTRNHFIELYKELTETLPENFRLHYHSSNKPYAKKNLEMFTFIEDFYKTYNILLDPIYTGKAMYGLFENSAYIEKGSKVVFIHSGGIQAWKGYFYRYPNLKEKIPVIYKLICE